MSMSRYEAFELSAEHQRALFDQADANRLYREARAARVDRPPRSTAARHWLACLRLARAVRIRPIRADDDVLLKDGFGRLSTESRRSRFLGAKTVLTPKELRYLTDVDHHDHEALVAVSRSDGSGIGVARYIRDRDDSHSAEVAVTVVDEWQLCGIGTRLVSRLIDRARAEGVARFTALVLAENIGARRLLERAPGIATLVDRDGDRLSYRVELAGARRG